MAEKGWSWGEHRPVFVLTTVEIRCGACDASLGVLDSAAAREEWQEWTRFWVFGLTEEQREVLREQPCEPVGK